MIKYIPVILMGILLVSCGKKTVPAKTEEPAKPAVVKPITTPVPKVITVPENQQKAGYTTTWKASGIGKTKKTENTICTIKAFLKIKIFKNDNLY